MIFLQAGPGLKIEMNQTMTIREALVWGRTRLERGGLASPRLDAETLLALAISRDRTHLFAHPGSPVGDESLGRYRAWIDLRLDHYPIQYLRGSQEFYGRSFTVSPGVLIPRPETELLVETCLGLSSNLHSPFRPTRVLDIGTGSGCIAVTLAAENPGLEVTATDIDPLAVRIAFDNAQNLLPGRSNPVFFVSDLASCLAPFPRFDFILSNPPYVGWRDFGEVDPSVRLHEPRKAVFSGETGFELFRRIFLETRRLLNPDGRLLLEIGAGQAPQLITLASGLGWTNTASHRDLAGTPRCLVFAPVPEGSGKGSSA